MHENIRKKVVIGLSGGVDSSVAALLLKQSGYDVIGVTLHLCDDTLPSIDDAKKVAEKLDIPFHCLDLRNEFKKYVIDYFANEYTLGRTPNPCIECNKHLKFGLMLQKAKELFKDIPKEQLKTSLIQRKLQIGYGRASRIKDYLLGENKGNY